MDTNTITELFFVITGTAVIITTALLAVGLIYLIFFLRSVKRIAKTAEHATEIVSEDIAELRDSIRDKGVTIGAVAKFASGLNKRRVFGTKKK
jgi:hypothetical protein